jgi:hypothetical protein
MKQFIVLAAMLPLIMVFIMQFALEQLNQGRIAALQELVYSAKERAKQEGRFTPEIKAALAHDIAARFKLDEGDIVIEADAHVRYRQNSFDEREMIAYRVEVPIEKIMAGNKLMGISDGENAGRYVIKGSTASEKLRDAP